MPAARKQRDKRRFERRVCKIRRRHVSADMIDPDERDAEGKRIGFREGKPDKQGAQEPRAVCHGDRIEIARRYARLRNGAPDRFADRLRMRAGRDLGYDPAVFCLLGGRRENDARKKFSPPDDGRRRLVAGAFNAEDQRFRAPRSSRRPFRICHSFHPFFARSPAAHAAKIMEKRPLSACRESLSPFRECGRTP